jgi:predicted molibdopterin-dependent oxidoreductase YjgC
VDVVSQRGRVRNVELRVTETIAPGQVFVPFHYAEANANQVTQSAFDPISREPNYKQAAVRVEKSAGIGDRGSGIGSAASVVRKRLRSFGSPITDPRSLPGGGR